MDNVTMAANGLLLKINSLFNNPLYSDIQFVFMNKDGTVEIIYCHKLILALQSKVFAHQFFEEGTSSTVKIKASKQQLFHQLFKFLYTGEVHFDTFNEAQSLYELANDYFVEELIEKCQSYMLQSSLTVENLFSRYNHALKQQIDGVLTDCRKFLCSNVEIVLKSSEFINASPEVVEDIVKLDNLPLSSELEIITAVINWAFERINRNEENLRKSIDPFLKHLRILTLTSAEFEYLVQHYNVFSGYESMALIQKIMIPESTNRLPESFCSITTKRNTTVLSHRSTAEYQQNKVAKSNSPTSVRSDLIKPLKSSNNKISYTVRKYPMKNGSSFELKEKFNSSPNICDLEFPAPNFSQNLLRDFPFPLKENEKSFTLSFRKDINCSVIIEMISGNLCLYGLELKVKNTSEKKDKKEIYVSLEGFSKQCFEKSYNLELLQNDVQSIKFPEPMRLQERNKGTIEVSIENLSLDRCSQIRKKIYELNSGLNFKCEFCINSNQKSHDENILFFINKLIYVSF